MLVSLSRPGQQCGNTCAALCLWMAGECPSACLARERPRAVTWTEVADLIPIKHSHQGDSNQGAHLALTPSAALASKLTWLSRRVLLSCQ